MRIGAESVAGRGVNQGEQLGELGVVHFAGVGDGRGGAGGFVEGENAALDEVRRVGIDAILEVAIERAAVGFIFDFCGEIVDGVLLDVTFELDARHELEAD